MSRASEICDRYDILMVCDEVMAGFGRTGRWFAVDHWDTVPDLMTMAKGLTSSYLPLGAVAMNHKVAEKFDSMFYSGGLTYSSHPVSLADYRRAGQVKSGLVLRRRVGRFSLLALNPHVTAASRCLQRTLYVTQLQPARSSFSMY